MSAQVPGNLIAVAGMRFPANRIVSKSEKRSFRQRSRFVPIPAAPGGSKEDQPRVITGKSVCW